MISRLRKSLGFLAIAQIATLAIPQFSVAQSDREDDDPPSRVARLSYTGGPVSFEPAGTDDWVTVVANRPITTGDKLWVDRDGRAELRFGSTAVRLGAETGFSFLNLDDRGAQIRLTEGTLNIRVKRLDDDETIEVDTPNLAFTVLRPGSYRVSVNEAGDATFIKVRGGDGEVTGGGAAYAVHANQTATFAGTDQLSADIQGYYDDDEFDHWCNDRDRRWDHSASARYVSDDVVGYEDLDEYGGWRQVPEYGTVWFPHTTVVGWAPYRYGHWAFIAPWGWTWVDDAPWGFAPFHYGRWVFVGGYWGWVPCPPRPAVVTVAYVRPVYAPALVAWVGGAHWGVGVSVGGPPAVGVAWFPLGPRDVYCPSYHVGPRYVERVNVSNTTIINRTQVTNVYNNVYVNKTVNVTNITYQNQHINNAVTATSQATFTSAQPVHNNIIRVNEREVTAAPVAPTGPAVVPQQRSVLGAGAEARVRPAVPFASRPVVAKTTPPPAPVPFARQQQAIQQNGGRPISVSEERRMQPEASRPNVRIAPPARQMPPQNANVNRPNQPNQGNPPVQGNPQNQQNPAIQQGRPPQPGNNSNRPTITNDNIQPGREDRGNAGREDRGNRDKYNDRPPTARPNVTPPANPQLDQKHQQELENLRQQQDRERQRVEQQQAQQQQKVQQQQQKIEQQQDRERQRVEPQQAQQQQKVQQQQPDQRRQQENQREQQNADRNRQQVEQRQQKQLEQLEQKHEQQQQKLEQKQQREEQKAARQDNKPAKQQKEQKNDPRNDKPPHR